jgi:outer membrane lipoprotein-sorting protein
MKKIFALVGLITLTFGIFFAGCTEQMSADEIAKKMEEKYDSINDMSCKMVMTMNVQGNFETISYDYKYKKPNKYYMESDDSIIVSDGNTMYVYDKKQNTYMKIDAPPKQKGDYGALIKNMFDLYDIEYVGDEKVSDRDCYVLKLNPKNKTGSIVVSGGALKMWVDKEYWQPLKIEMNGDGFSSTIEYQNVKYNVGLSDDVFKFTPPKDAKLIENGIPKEMTIEDAQKEVPFKILVPKYTAGYEFKSAIPNEQNGVESVILQYVNTDENDAIVIIESNSKNSNSIPNAEKVKIGNIDGEYAKSMGGSMLSFKKDGIVVVIIGNLEKEELIKIGESMIN